MMLKALTNELLKVLLQPVKMLLPRCSSLPGPPAPCKARGTEDVLPPRPWSSLVCVGLAMGGDGRSAKWKEGQVDTRCVLLTWCTGSKLLREGSNIFRCCSGLLREHVTTSAINIRSPESITLLFLLPSSLLH